MLMLLPPHIQAHDSPPKHIQELHPPLILLMPCPAVVQLLTPSYMLSKTNGRDGISKGDLEEADSLFHDAKYSARMLAEQADKYIT